MTDLRETLLDELGWPHSPKEVELDEGNTLTDRMANTKKQAIAKIQGLDASEAKEALDEFRESGHVSLPFN